MDRVTASAPGPEHALDQGEATSGEIGLTTDDTRETHDEEWKRKALEHGITFAAVTYRDLCEALGEACLGDPELLEILNDYQSFIDESGVRVRPGDCRRSIPTDA